MTANLSHIKGKFTNQDGTLTKYGYDVLRDLEGLVLQALTQAGEAAGVGEQVTVLEENVQQAIQEAVTATATGNGNIRVGTILMYGGSTAPTGYVFCRGQAISRTVYPALFSVIGTTFGVGDGSTTFNVPDLRNRYPIGADTVARGATAGANTDDISHTHGTGTLVTASDGAHTHSADGTLAAAATATTVAVQSGAGTTVPTDTHTHDVTGDTSSNGAHTHTISGSTASGGSAAHDNRPASLGVNFIIKI